MIYLSSDLHFNHDREFIWGARGFSSVNEMNEAIIERFNSVVSSEDTVYLLGDICLGGGTKEVLEENKKLIERLNGELIILRGNHDSNSRVEMYKTCKNVISAGEWATMIDYRKYHFYMSHFPTLTTNLEKESLHQCTCNLFGHTHQKNNFNMGIPSYYHVGVDSHDCYPISLNNIIEEMKIEFNKCLEQL